MSKQNNNNCIYKKNSETNKLPRKPIFQEQNVSTSREEMEKEV